MSGPTAKSVSVNNAAKQEWYDTGALPAGATAVKDDRLRGPRAWFAEAKFGMFIHFSLFSLPGLEDRLTAGTISRSGYEAHIRRFNPTRFDADKWVALAKNNEARYIVFTAKHVEGFCLWHTRYTAFNVMNSPFRRDVVRELAEACRRQRIRFCVYYAASDDHYKEPGEGAPEATTYQGYVTAQLRELLTQYGPVYAVWFDGGDPRLRMKPIVDMIHGLQPACAVNNRSSDIFYGDYATPERNIPDTLGKRHAFLECCDAIGQKSWRHAPEQGYWSGPELIRRLSRVAAAGGNYLLNVDPTGAGVINPASVARMETIGLWLKRHREAVFGASANPARPRDAWIPMPVIGVATQRDKVLYVHLHQWPAGDSFLLNHVSGRVRRAALLGSPAQLEVEKTSDGLLVRRLPINPPDTSVNIVRLEFAAAPQIDERKIIRARRVVIHARPGETVYLRAADAERTSKDGVPAHSLNRFANGNVSIGPIYRLQEAIIWHLELERSGCYEVLADMAAAAYQKGGVFSIEAGGRRFEGKTVETKWRDCYNDTPKRLKLGRVRLKAGAQRVRFRMVKARTFHIGHVHNIVLQPA